MRWRFGAPDRQCEPDRYGALTQPRTRRVSAAYSKIRSKVVHVLAEH
jgi:hypothetical protein